DGFKFGLGLWLATALVGTVWMVIISLIIVAITGS
ncbi:unnamed protein product, partial [marine sediment metagenome]